MAAHRDQDWDKHVAGPVITNTLGLLVFAGGGKRPKMGKQRAMTFNYAETPSSNPNI